MDEEQGRQQQAGWQFNPDDNLPAGGAVEPKASTLEPVRWTASEYIAHHKTPGWFVMLGLATAGLTAVVYMVTGGDVLSATMIGATGVIFGVFAARRPEVLEYVISTDGLRIGIKHYSWGEFKSFAVVRENAIRSIMLLPLKRFRPPISIYYAPEDEAKIVEILAACLPVEQREQDPLERLMHRLRF